MSRVHQLHDRIDSLEMTILSIKAKLFVLQPNQLVYIVENTTDISQDKFPEMLLSIINRVKNNQIISDKQKEVLINLIVYGAIKEQE